MLTSLKKGRYENESEVARTALRTLERETHEQAAKLASLQTAIEDGDASGLAEPGTFDRVRQHLQFT